MVDVVARPENQLHLPRVLPPRREQPVRRQRRGRILPPPDDRDTPLRHPLPQRRRRMEHEHMHVAPDRERAQHVEMPRGQPRQPEERQPRRQIDDPRLLPQPRTSTLNPLRRIRNPDPRPQPPPQLGLPHPVGRHRPILPPSPGTNHLRPMQGVPIEQLREMPNRTEPPSPPRRIRRPRPIPPDARPSSPTTAPPDTHPPPRAEPKPPAPATTDRHPPRSQTPSPPHPRRAAAATGSRRSRTPHRPAHPPPRADPTSAARATAPCRASARRRPPARTDRATDRRAAREAPRPGRQPAQLDGREARRPARLDECGALRAVCRARRPGRHCAAASRNAAPGIALVSCNTRAQ